MFARGGGWGGRGSIQDRRGMRCSVCRVVEKRLCFVPSQARDDEEERLIGRVPPFVSVGLAGLGLLCTRRYALASPR